MQYPSYLKIPSQIVSVLFHPLIIPTLGCFVVFNSGFYLGLLPQKVMQAVYIVVFVLTFLLPSLIIPALYLQKYITSFSIENRKERILPLAVVAIMYGLSYYFMQRSGFPPILLKFIMASLISIVVSMLVTLKWKISLHTMGLGGLTGLILYLSIAYSLHLHSFIIVVILISGITATSRMIAGDHTPAQVYTGFVGGTIIVALAMALL